MLWLSIRTMRGRNPASLGARLPERLVPVLQRAVRFTRADIQTTSSHFSLLFLSVFSRHSVNDGMHGVDLNVHIEGLCAAGGW